MNSTCLTRTLGTIFAFSLCAIAGKLFAAATDPVDEQEGTSGAFGSFWEAQAPIVISTDYTPKGRLLTPPTKQNPTYFEAFILGYKEYGVSIAGEKTPSKDKLIKLIFKVLADQGYYPCDKTHKATLLLAFSWGSMHQNPGVSLGFMGGDKFDLLWENNPNTAGGMIDPRVSSRFMRSVDAQMIMQMSGSNLYMAYIQAFDEAAAMNYELVPLWRTKIACSASRIDMDAAIRRMVRVAGPLIGKDSPRPVVTVPPVHNARVEAGEAKVIEMLDIAKLPITDASKPDKP